MIVIKAPEVRTGSFKTWNRLFLAGTIDMGNSKDWQSELCERIETEIGHLSTRNLTIFNPRREEWDSSWEQSYSNPYFYQQVTWELNSIKDSNLVLFHFEEDSKSPITFLELGLVANSKPFKKRIAVSCKPGFYRYGNIQIVCDMFKIPLFEEPFEAAKFLIDNT